MKMNHILCWNYVFLLGFISSICLVSSHNDKKSILPQLVDNIVENEIVRKVPAVKNVVKKAAKRNKLAGSHMKAATDAINKLVDESIVNRVEEAEREVSQMLLKNIEHHIQDAGKIFISPDEKETACRDKLDGCDKLAKAGVCKTSRDAMKINCRHTCNYCHVILDPDMQAKLSKELESHNDGKDKMLSIKYHEKGRHKKHHRKHHIGSDTVDRLATDEIGMLGEEVTNHDNPSLEREKAPVIFHHREKDKDRDMDEAEKLLATERKLKEAKELEHIKEEANKLLAAHKKVIKQKQREEAAKLLATEKKLKQEEMQIDAKVKQERRKHMHKKKKQTVHRTPAKGKKTSDDEAIPFLNEDPYPLTDFVSEYDKTAETKMTDDENTDNKNKISKKEETVTHNATEKTDQNVSVQPAEEQKSHTSSHSSDINQDIGESPSRIVMKYHDKLHEDDIKNTTESSKINLDDKSDDKHDDVSKKHTTIDMTEHKQEDNTDTVGDAYSKLNNNQEANLGDADIQRHLPMLDEKDVVSENTAEMMNDKEIVEQQQHDDKQTTSNFIENEDKPKQTKNNGDMKDQIQTMLDQAFGEVLST